MLKTKTVQSIHSGSLILVNAEHSHQEVQDDSSLQCAGNGIMLESQTKQAWCEAVSSLEAWDRIMLVSGYRPLQEQKNLYRDCLMEHGEEHTRKYVALPGCSEHQTGLAFDVALQSEDVDIITPFFPDWGIAKEFRRQAAQHGLIERYPRGKEHITGIGHEPWHFRYVGYPHSVIIARYNLALEEYIELLRLYPCGRPLRYGEYEISLLPESELEFFPLAAGDQLSGNNVDGYILTRRR